MWFRFKNQNWILPACDSFPLIVSQMGFNEGLNFISVCEARILWGSLDSLPVDLCINLKKLARESTWILAESLRECCDFYTVIFEPALMVKCLVHVQKTQIAHSSLNSRPLLCEASSNLLNSTMFLMLKPEDVKFCFLFSFFFLEQDFLGAVQLCFIFLAGPW